MGGSALTLRLEPVKGAAADARGFYEDLFDALERNVLAFAKGAAYDQVLADYLHACKPDAEVSDRALLFVFSDRAGLCNMSSAATKHWFEVLLAAFGERLDDLARSHGLVVREKGKSLEDALASCDEPLIELRKNLFAISDSRQLLSDDLGKDTLDYERLKPAEKKQVDAIASARKCACKVCEALRAHKPLKLPKPSVAAPKPKYELRPGGSLLLSDPSLTEFPRELLTQPVEKLNVGLVEFTTLPADIDAMQSLRHLSIGGLTELPESFGRLKLTHLALTAPEFPSWEPIYAMKSLRALWMNSAPELAASLEPKRLAHLEELEFPRCELAKLPRGMASLAKLRVLMLYGNALTEVGELPPVRELDLGANRLTTVPRAVASLPLESLRLTGNPITTFGEDALPRTLRKLKLDETKKLTALPESLGELTALEELHITESKLEKLPDSMRKLKKLTHLRLAETSLPELPAWFGELHALRTLHIYGSAFTHLPESMRAMRSLETLGLFGTKVFPLPDWIAKLTSLKLINATPALLPRGELQRLKRLLPKVRINTAS